MTVGTRALKAFSGVGAVVVCGVSGLLVAIDPKPAGAPLRPPVSGSSSIAAALVIPPSCGGVGAATSGSAATLDPSLIPAVRQFAQATTASERRAIIASLSASQRLEVEAYVRALRRNAQGATGRCDGSGAATGGGSIAPSVVDAPPSTQPLINTYVS
ncbi:MAG TPA: hypothetical protein VND54_10255 [Candidatus Saccharimonadales bacterium]|nr:hypothetical protein [Candidatus Saccharimonadales bacterium]